MKKKLHAKPHRVTIERVRKCEKFKNATDEEALDVIHSLERLSLILFEHGVAFLNFGLEPKSLIKIPLKDNGNWIRMTITFIRSNQTKLN